MSDPTPEAPDLTNEALAQLIDTALNPQLGEPFTFGGETFTRRFLNGEGEHALTVLIAHTTEGMPVGSIAEAFTRSLDALFAAVAIILSAQNPMCDEDWIRAVEGPGIAKQLLGIFLAQVKLQEMLPLLGGLLAAAGLAHAVAAKSATFPSTSPETP